MDPLNEKKWFVYIEDHHEGPYSVLEVRDKITQSTLSSDQYVWTEGMQDWKPMLEIEDFKTLLASVGQQEPSSPSLADAIGISGELSEAPSIEISKDHSHTGDSVSFNTSKETSLSKDTQSLPVEPSKEPVKKLGKKTEANISPVNDPILVQSKPKKKRRLLRFFVLLILVGGAGYAYQTGMLDPFLDNPQIKGVADTISRQVSPLIEPLTQKIVQTFPVLSEYFSPLPKIADVSPQDYESLKASAQSSLRKGGLSVALAPSTAGGPAPSFYIASNLPDGANFQIYLLGYSETLLNALGFATDLTVTLNKRIGRTSPITQKDGNPIPKGEYDVYVFEADQQPQEVKAAIDAAPATAQAHIPEFIAKNKKIVTSTKLFLGGVRDKIYEDRLAEYHSMIRERASRDIIELQQWINTLKEQYNKSYRMWEKYRSSPKGKTAWNKESGPWIKIQEAMVQANQWSPEALQSTFYPNVYQDVRSATTTLLEMHMSSSQFFQGTQPPDFQPKLIALQQKTKDLLQGLLARIANLETSVIKNKELPKKIEGY